MNRNNNFSEAKVYMIMSNITGEVYYGSTCENLTRRLSRHVNDYKRYLQGKRGYTTSFKVIEKGEYKIALVEKVNCTSKDELISKERSWIEDNICVNKVSPNCRKKNNPEGKQYEVHRCDCGLQYTNQSKSRHLKTKWHSDFIEVESQH